jgi:hypothetical protein
MLTENELIEKVKNDYFFKELFNYLDSNQFFYGGYDHIILVGGALLNIAEGTIPKDYDFLNTKIIKIIASKKGQFICESDTATTYSLFGKIVQILKVSNTDKFDYSIGANKFYINYNFYDSTYKCNSTLTECPSYQSKVLVPLDYSRKGAINSLVRLKHWEKKGYNLPEFLYLRLIAIATNSPEINITSKIQS